MFKLSSTKFFPLNTNTSVAIFLKQTMRDICKLSRTKCNPQLTPEENEALKSLCKNVTIVVKPSDKGGNVVIMDNQDYILMCKKILNNTDGYKNIYILSIGQYNANFYKMVDQSYGNGAITRDLYDFVRTKHPKWRPFTAYRKSTRTPKKTLAALSSLAMAQYPKT